MASTASLPQCLVCGAPTASIHFGVQVCRSCTVFYRRACKKPQYACRAINSRCTVTQDGSTQCKRCRFERYEEILNRSRAQSRNEGPSSEIPPQIEKPSSDRQAAGGSKVPRPLLDKCGTCYKMLCSMRRNSELAARGTLLHPSQITTGEYDIPPSTCADLNLTCRFLLAGIIDLAHELFPEFIGFSSEEQWTLSVNFAKRFFLLDSAHRAEKIFPDDMTKCLGAYTSYMSLEAAEHFFDDCRIENSNIDEAKEVLKQYIRTTFPELRRAVRSVKLDEVEFHAMLILIFWFSDSSPLREDLILVGERYRQKALKELQSHYSEDLKLDEFAGRIGELFMLILNFDRSVEVDEQFEVFRLLGVFADDTFVYRLDTRFDNK
ncbi:hypothetical protein PRIPAC_82838 [Pristionchus pacificus]|uniref:Nuclear receptor n=1 Tax=Pristionchus pacificus TaxID=54126 RepID=A0A2A6CMJ5_PRIPA|nr:hypothetical protein PRIPAC_82838 [Pristionchus pacificus]|eukprot:PDM79326.1 nuclear receptor [Pristionchus pacificus]